MEAWTWPDSLDALTAASITTLIDHFVRRDAVGAVLLDTREGGVLPRA